MSQGISLQGSPSVLKASGQNYSSNFLGRWPDVCGHLRFHSIAYGKLEAYKIYIKVIRIFKFWGKFVKWIARTTDFLIVFLLNYLCIFIYICKKHI